MVARAGATVVAVSRSDDNLDEHIAPLVAEGLPIVPVAADASTDEGIATAIDAVRRADGRAVRSGQRGRRCGAVDVDARDPGQPG